MRPLRFPSTTRRDPRAVRHVRSGAQPRAELERGAEQRRHGHPPPPEDGRAPDRPAALGADPVLDVYAKQTRPINGRSETAATNGTFKAALASRRCLVPADAFYEWRAMPDGKQPYAIARRDGSPLAFAGVWEWWRAPDETVMRTFAILTTAANATVRQLHHRMPVILEPDAWSLWLGDTVAPIDLTRPAVTTCCTSGRLAGRQLGAKQRRRAAGPDRRPARTAA